MSVLIEFKPVGLYEFLSNFYNPLNGPKIVGCWSVGCPGIHFASV